MLLVFLASINFSASACIVSAIGLRVPSLQTASCRFWAQLLGASISIVVQKVGRLTDCFCYHTRLRSLKNHRLSLSLS
eukprot:08375_6